MRKLLCSLCLVLALWSLIPAPLAQAEGPPETWAASAIVMNSGGEIVFEKNADTRSLIASTTKLMTALVVLEHADVNEDVEILPEWTEVEGSSMYLPVGAHCTVRQLLEGLLLASGNDAATALACHTAGSVEAFAALMNEKAQALGMTGSRFANPHGLDDKDHYGTARDLAALMAACMREEELAVILSERSAQVGEQTYVNHNKLLTICPGCLGGKTGYTEAAGRCLVSCCEREGTRLICVTLDDPNDWVDHQQLYNWAFANYSTRDVTESLRFFIPVDGGEEQLEVRARELRLFLPRTAEITLVAHMPRFIFAPVAEGESAGTVWVFRGGEKIDETELYFTEGTEKAD